MVSGANKQVFWVWADMIRRCSNPRHKAFHNYGGRGITVCEKWKSWKAFSADMEPRPEGLMIDRIDNNKGYSPENCRWVTRKEQNSNRRNCIYVTDGDEKITVREYCRRRDIPYRAIMKRIKYRNWPMDEALKLPIGTRRPV